MLWFAIRATDHIPRSWCYHGTYETVTEPSYGGIDYQIALGNASISSPLEGYRPPKRSGFWSQVKQNHSASGGDPLLRP